MGEITIWMFRSNLFTNNSYTVKSGWDSGQFKLLTIEKIVCIAVIKVNYASELKINQTECAVNC